MKTETGLWLWMGSGLNMDGMDELTIDDDTVISLEICSSGHFSLRFRNGEGERQLTLRGMQLELHRAIIEADRQLSLLTHGLVGLEA